MVKSKTRVKTTRSVAVRSSLITIAAMLVFGGVIAGIHSLSYAAAAGTAYITPASGSHTVGTTFSVVVRENSGTNNVNSVDVTLNYSSTNLKYISADVGSSGFDTAGPSSQTTGSIAIARNSSAGVTGDQSIETITFQVLAAGTGTVSFANGSGVYDTTSHQNDMNTFTPASLTLAAAVVVAPPVTPPVVTPPPTVTPPATTTKIGTTTTSVAFTPKGSTTPVSVPDASPVRVTTNVTITPDTSAAASATAAPATAATTQVQYYLNGKSVAIVTKAPFSYQVESVNLRNGSYALETKTTYADGTTRDSKQQLLIKNPYGVKQFSLDAAHYSPVWVTAVALAVVGTYMYIMFRKRNVNNRHFPPSVGGSGGVDLAKLGVQPATVGSVVGPTPGIVQPPEN